MFHKIFITIFIVCVIDYSSSQTCQEDIAKFFDCIHNLKEKQDKIVQTDIEKKRSEEKECFNKNKCRLPEFEKTTTEDPVLEKRKRCRIEVTEKAHNLTSQCIQSKSGISFPGTKGKDKSRYSISLIGQVRNLCPDNKTADEVSDCLRNITNKSAGERALEKKTSTDRFKEFCSKKQECFSKNMNKDCQNKFNETQAIRCECAKSEIKSKEKDLNTQFFSCANIKSGLEKDTAGFEVDDIIYQACTQKDPCHKSSQPDVQ